jgi:CRP-like cAMP-binding protein
LPTTGTRACKNLYELLRRLSQRDYGLLAPHLVAVDLPLRKYLERRGRGISAAHFVESGIASVVANGRVGAGVEVGLVGRDGMTGVAALLGADRATYDTYMQIAGDGQCIKISNLKRCVAESHSLLRACLKYSHAFNVQVAHTAMINARSRIEERLARWLLVAHDRLDGDDLPLTHEFLATMLGVRRPGVTVALHDLQQRGLIQPARGSITVLDRKGLEQAANGRMAPAKRNSAASWVNDHFIAQSDPPHAAMGHGRPNQRMRGNVRV